MMAMVSKGRATYLPSIGIGLVTHVHNHGPVRCPDYRSILVGRARVTRGKKS